MMHATPTNCLACAPFLQVPPPTDAATDATAVHGATPTGRPQRVMAAPDAPQRSRSGSAASSDVDADGDTFYDAVRGPTSDADDEAGGGTAAQVGADLRRPPTTAADAEGNDAGDVDDDGDDRCSADGGEAASLARSLLVLPLDDDAFYTDASKRRENEEEDDDDDGDDESREAEAEAEEEDSDVDVGDDTTPGPAASRASSSPGTGRARAATGARPAAPALTPIAAAAAATSRSPWRLFWWTGTGPLAVAGSPSPYNAPRRGAGHSPATAFRTPASRRRQGAPAGHATLPATVRLANLVPDSPPANEAASPLVSEASSAPSPAAVATSNPQQAQALAGTPAADGAAAAAPAPPVTQLDRAKQLAWQLAAITVEIRERHVALPAFEGKDRLVEGLHGLFINDPDDVEVAVVYLAYIVALEKVRDGKDSLNATVTATATAKT